ncbi:hypothetical protein MRY16398_08400 [Phytobacter sp. MRY16-398]|nr:hypothetical protein MRY16398_08400 [Phytobacter sp. MRY16-398]
MNENTFPIFVMVLNAGAIVQSGADTVDDFQKKGGTGQSKPDNPGPGHMIGTGDYET